MQSKKVGPIMKVVLSLLSVIAMATIATGTASAGGIDISTPTGLNAGDHFRFVFVTATTTTATSTDISTYDTFVNTDANSATYNGTLITWKAIGSTSSVSAINHIGVTGYAVYDVNGNQIATDDTTSGLWSGSILQNINTHIDGSTNDDGGARAWTGTTTSGDQKTDHTLGDAAPQVGRLSKDDNRWIDYIADGAYPDNTNTYYVYGISGDLVVPGATTVPEPSTAMLAGLGSLVGLAYSMARKRK